LTMRSNMRHLSLRTMLGKRGTRHRCDDAQRPVQARDRSCNVGVKVV